METSKGSGVPGGLPFVLYPVHVGTHSKKELEETAQTTIADQVVKALTVQPKEASLPPEWDIGQAMFRGTFEEVNELFYHNEWSDGLPIVPPTLDKVKEFLKHTDRTPNEGIGVIKPDHRKATVWSIAVNGVMSGCRPEYMPVLIALVEAMADPKFFVENIGNTPGGEALIILNGPIIKQLDFNYTQGATRVGFQANTSIGRFWRLYLRNVAGFLLHKTDKASFGGTFRVVLAENEDAVRKIGWEPLSVDQGFKAGDNVVTVSVCVSCKNLSSVSKGEDPEMPLAYIADEMVNQIVYYRLNYRGVSTRPHLILTPSIAEFLSKDGFSKADIKRYLYKHARRPEWYWMQINKWMGDITRPTPCEYVKKGQLPKAYCESTDPNRLLPLVYSPDDFLIVVSGDPARNNAMICDQNAIHGWTVSKKIELPPNWDELLKKAKAEKEALLKELNSTFAHV